MNWYLHELVESGPFDGERRVFVVSKSFDCPDLDAYRVTPASTMEWAGVEQVAPEDYSPDWIADDTMNPNELLPLRL